MRNRMVKLFFKGVKDAINKPLMLKRIPVNVGADRARVSPITGNLDLFIIDADLGALGSDPSFGRMFREVLAFISKLIEQGSKIGDGVGVRYSTSRRPLGVRGVTARLKCTGVSGTKPRKVSVIVQGTLLLEAKADSKD